MTHLENAAHDLRALVVSHFGLYQHSVLFTEKVHVICHLGDGIGQHGSTNMLYVNVYENLPVVSKEKY